MKTLYLFLFAALTFACGAPPEDAGGIDLIGSKGQPIFMPNLYGSENGPHPARPVQSPPLG